MAGRWSSSGLSPVTGKVARGCPLSRGRGPAGVSAPGRGHAGRSPAAAGSAAPSRLPGEAAVSAALRLLQRCAQSSLPSLQRLGNGGRACVVFPFPAAALGVRG